MVTEFGKHMRIIRIRSGDSTKEMAEKIGLSVPYLSAIEVGKRAVPEYMVALLTEAYSLTEKESEILQNSISPNAETDKQDMTGF